MNLLLELPAFIVSQLLSFFKGIVSKLAVKFWMSQICGKMKDYNNKNDYKYCTMITNTLDRIIITK
jgi:hypothetical protein